MLISRHFNSPEASLLLEKKPFVGRQERRLGRSLLPQKPGPKRKVRGPSES